MVGLLVGAVSALPTTERFITILVLLVLVGTRDDRAIVVLYVPYKLSIVLLEVRGEWRLLVLRNIYMIDMHWVLYVLNLESGLFIIQPIQKSVQQIVSPRVIYIAISSIILLHDLVGSLMSIAEFRCKGFACFNHSKSIDK